MIEKIVIIRDKIVNSMYKIFSPSFPPQFGRMVLVGPGWEIPSFHISISPNNGELPFSTQPNGP